MLDCESKKYILTRTTFDGEKIKWTDIDPKSDTWGLSDTLDMNELLDDYLIKFIQNNP